MIRTPPRMRKYSMNAGLVTQNPVSGKQLALSLGFAAWWRKG